MVDMKKEQERDELHRASGPLPMNYGVVWTVGILRPMY